MFSAFERSRIAAVVLIACSMAGCSADVTRFEDDPFANPYKSQARRSEVTGSGPVQPAPSNRIEAQPLPQVQSYQPYQSLPPPPASPYAPVESRPGAAGSPSGIGSYDPTSPPPASDVTGSIKPSPSHSGWTWDGGTAIVVRPGETIESLSRKYGVPVAAIKKANGFTPGSTLHPGQQVVIPRYSYGSVVAASPTGRLTPHSVAGGAPPVLHGPRVAQASTVHIVQAHETLTSIARHHGKTVAEIAAANHIPPYAGVRMGERLIIPGTAVTSVKPSSPPILAAPQPRTASNEQHGWVAKPPETRNDDEGGGGLATGTASVFRWPAHGRVIIAFHEKLANGQLNNGINIALPEGTLVRAAEDGEVVYAGSELKSYGNLILISHSNGFATAYANTSDILVKRNDRVRRGQEIAHAGQTGIVSTPQLHFEVRKGKVPVDPMQYLPAVVGRAAD
jgi:murein DD-endopeptidase MepM/ murein hydrolase activator NlpD